jgi:GNAT superfamily N-acetyltransferase
VLRPDQLRHIRDFWCTFLGCTEAQLLQPGVHVVPHGGLAGYAGIWAFRVGDSCVISVPQSMRAAEGKAASGLSCEQVFCSGGLTSLVGACQVERVIGPCFVGYHGGRDLRQRQGAGNCRLLSKADAPQIAQLQRACGGDWEIGGVDPDAGEVVFGCFDGAQLLAAASYELWGQKIAHVCVVAAPEFRRRGSARSAAARVTEHAKSCGLLPQWRTEYSNISAMAIGRALGFEEFGSHYALRLMRLH